MKLRNLLLLSVILITINGSLAQTPEKSNATICRAGDLQFTCPESFKQLPDVDRTTALFEYKNEDSVVYFFIGAPAKQFDFSKVQTGIGKHFSAGTFRWKRMPEVFMMSMKTKYEKTLIGHLGFDSRKLVNLTSATFSFKGKSIVLGYAWDSETPDPAETFATGLAMGDHAVGCNAIVNTLNSITNEFPGEEQYCFLKGFGAPPK